MNPSVKVDFGGQPRSRGSKRKGAPEQWRNERRETEAVTLAVTRARPGWGHLPHSPEAFALKHRVVLHREGSGNREDGGARDRGGRGMRPSRQKIEEGTKHNAGTRPPR